MHPTERQQQPAGGLRPLDVADMRRAARRVLEPGWSPPSAAEVAKLTATLTEHLDLLVGAVRELVAATSDDDPVAKSVRVCIAEATRRVDAKHSDEPGAAHGYAAKLAFSVLSLCNHHEKLASAPTRARTATG